MRTRECKSCSGSLHKCTSTRISPVVILLTTHMDSHRLLCTCATFLLYFTDLEAEAKAVSSCDLVQPSAIGRMRRVPDTDVTVRTQYFMFMDWAKLQSDCRYPPRDRWKTCLHYALTSFLTATVCRKGQLVWPNYKL